VLCQTQIYSFGLVFVCAERPDLKDFNQDSCWKLIVFYSGNGVCLGWDNIRYYLLTSYWFSWFIFFLFLSVVLCYAKGFKQNQYYCSIDAVQFCGAKKSDSFKEFLDEIIVKSLAEVRLFICVLYTLFFFIYWN